VTPLTSLSVINLPIDIFITSLASIVPPNYAQI
jgi:hypothetical protein